MIIMVKEMESIASHSHSQYFSEHFIWNQKPILITDEDCTIKGFLGTNE